MTAQAGKTVLVCGGITYARALFDCASERARVVTERAHLFRVLDELNAVGQTDEWKLRAVGFGNIRKVLACGIDGASTCAGDWAITTWNAWDTFSADFQRYGARAMSERTRYVFEEVCPDVVIVFPGDGPEDILAFARRHQIKRQLEVRSCCAVHPLPAKLSAAHSLQ